jgi:dolichol-phosphate mannosyltransferase
MLKAAENADLVIGSRLIDGGFIMGRSFWRDSLSIVANTVIRILTCKEVFDWTSGLRVYRRALWEDVMTNVHCDKWDFQFESLYKTVKQGYRVCEVPITFYERADGESKFSLREGLVFLGSFLRIVFKLK